VPKVLIALVIAAAALQALAQPQLEEPRAAPRSLVISVRFDDAGQAAQRDIAASGRISNRGAEVEVRAQDERSAREQGIVQRVLVLDGGRATLFVGQSRPLTHSTAGIFRRAAPPRLHPRPVLHPALCVLRFLHRRTTRRARRSIHRRARA